MTAAIIRPALGCPKCGRDTGVKETRSLKGYIRRRRVCNDRKCDGRLTTVEVEHPGGGSMLGLERPLLLPRAKVEAFIKQLQEWLTTASDDE